MSDYRRPRVGGATIFFTVALQARGSDLLLREVGLLREAVRCTRAERPFRIDAWVVLPDHLHCVWTLPEEDAEYSVRWGAIKARFTRAVREGGRVGFHPTPHPRSDGDRTATWNPPRSASKIRKGDAGIWQRRYWEHHIRGDADYAAHLRYCWINPVKHRLVRRPEDWPWSSYHRDAGGGWAG